jgi:hypothetical protein
MKYLITEKQLKTLKKYMKTFINENKNYADYKIDFDSYAEITPELDVFFKGSAYVETSTTSDTYDQPGESNSTTYLDFDEIELRDGNSDETIMQGKDVLKNKKVVKVIQDILRKEYDIDWDGKSYS